MLQSYNLETKHYVILAVLGVVECVLFALMFYNCFLELRQKRRQRKYQQTNPHAKSDEEKGNKPSLMEIFSVDMTLNRDKSMLNHTHTHNHIHTHTQTNVLPVVPKISFTNSSQNHNKAHRPSRNSL